MRSALFLVLTALVALSLPAQETTPEAVREHLEKAAATANQWVFLRNWEIHAACPELGAMVEAMLNQQIRQAMAGAPVAPPPARIQFFILSRRAGTIDMKVKLAGLPEEMERMFEGQANQWLATAPQANMLKMFLLQPLAFPTLGQGALLKDADLKVHRETAEVIDAILTPGGEAQILGRPVRNMGLRIDKATHAIRLLQANFNDGAMIQAGFEYAAVRAGDGETYHIPATIQMKQRGIGAVAPGVALPETITMRYANHRVAAPAQ